MEVLSVFIQLNQFSGLDLQPLILHNAILLGNFQILFTSKLKKNHAFKKFSRNSDEAPARKLTRCRSLNFLEIRSKTQK
jgi:hypothetical protein